MGRSIRYTTKDEDSDPNRPPETGRVHTIKGRIFLLLLVLLIPIFFTQAYIFYWNFKNSREQALRSNLEVARSLGKAFDAFIQGIFRQELSIGLAATASPPLSNQELNRLLEKNAKDLLAIQRMTWIDPKGYSVASSLPSPSKVNFSDRKYFQEILAGRDCMVGDLVLSKAERLPLFHVCRALRDENGNLLGVALAAIDLEKMDSVLAVERTEEAAVSLLDSQGMLVYRYPYIKQTWEERNWVKAMPILGKGLKEEISGITAASYENENRIFANVPIKSIGWSAGAGIREKVVMKPIYTNLLYHGAIFSIITFLAVIGGLAISRTISSPVERLRTHARLLGNGEYDRRIDPTGPTEMRAFAQTFNVMAEQINKSHEELQKINQTLEQRVQERTEDLAKSQNRLQHLASQLILAQEKERKRVAVELHDGLLSELAAMKMLHEAKMKLLEEGNLSDLNELKRVSDILARVIKEARGIMNNLHPSVLDELGLIPAINWLVGEYEKSYPQIKVQKQFEVAEQDVSLSLRVVIFRVLQEALNNFAKHGKGNLVELSLSKSGGAFGLTIRDNGQGFDVEATPKGLGLESMRERVELSGGEFQIESTIGQGTTIRAIWSI